VARKSKNKEAPDGKNLGSKLRQIWAELGTDNWFAWLIEQLPASRFTRRGEHIVGVCPFHTDGSPSLIISPMKGLAKCFGCQKTYSCPVKFVRAVRALDGSNHSFSDTLVFLRKRFGLKSSIPEALYEKLQERETYQDMKAAFADWSGALLFDAMVAYPNLEAANLEWARPLVEWLMERNLGGYAPNELQPASAVEAQSKNPPADPYEIWARLCYSQLVGVFPPLAFINAKWEHDQTMLNFVRTYFAKMLEGQTYVGQLVFVLHDAPGSIARFKLRAPRSDSKAMTYVDDAYAMESGDFRGYFGLHFARAFLGSDENGVNFLNSAYLVEGEFDVLSPLARMLRQGSTDFLILAAGGGSVQGADKLLEFGITNIFIVGDRDKGGENFTQLLLEKSSSPKLTFKVFNWPDEYANWRDAVSPAARVKDPDEAIKHLGYPKFRRYLSDPDCYWQTYQWCFEQASVEISKVDEADVKQRYRVAREWGVLLKDATECGVFCSNIEKHFDGLDKGPLLRDIQAKDEDEEVFILRLLDVVKEHFHPVGVQNGENRKRILLLYNKRERAIDQIILNDETSIATAFSRYFGPLYDFVRDQVGEPGFMADEDEQPAFRVTNRVKKYKEYLNFALLKLAQGLPHLDHAPVKAQGLHFIDDVDGVLRAYLVNGRDVYSLVNREGGGYEVGHLSGPSDSGIIFDNSGEAWLHTVKKKEDLTLEDYSLPAAFETLRSMVDKGWAWKYQSVDPIFLASLTMCLQVMAIFSRQTAIMLNAEHESGKSRFTTGFIGGANYPRINVLANAVTMNGYTAASIRQRRNNSSLALCLEEFEDYGIQDSKSVQVRKVLELTRDMNSEKEVEWSVGTTSGEAKIYRIRFPMICCAIRPLQDAASISRFLRFELVKDASRTDPVITLIKEFGEPTIKELKKNLAVAFLPHMQALRKCQAEIEQEFATGKNLPAFASSRFREGVYPILAMLKFLKAQAGGEQIPDYKQFAYDFCISRKDELTALKTESQHVQLFETILSSPFEIASDETRVSWSTNIRVLLADLGKLDEINKTQKGVYFDAKMEWLAINWVSATQGVLARAVTWHKQNTSALNAIASRSPYYVSPADVVNGGILDRLVPYMGFGQNVDTVAVFSVKHLLDQARKAREVALVATPPVVVQPKDAKPVSEKIDDIEF